MRLLYTGAFVRAARQSRTGTVSSVGAAASVYASWPRWNSTQATRTKISPFPNQSTAPPAEVDPKKTEAISPEVASTPASRFRDTLRSQPPSQIVTDHTGLRGANILGQPFVFDQTSNLSPSILDLVGRNLYNIPNHPICITRRLIESVFAYPTYKNHVATNPIVSTHDNFDVLGFPADHPGRSRTDTYYVDSTHVLRTHTSAHQHAAFQYMSQNPETGYTICADVYRRDSIDRSHFPVFHQMEGARLWQLPEQEGLNETRYEQLKRRIYQVAQDIQALPTHNLHIIDEAGPYNYKTNPVQVNHDERETDLMGQHLKRSLELLVARVFVAAKEAGVGSSSPTSAQNDPDLKIRWIEAYFPFTSPSWELEVWWQGEWLELLGCGITQQSILNNAGLKDRSGWAWGLGIERLAMVLFGIPDIRLFWSTDSRFLSQFQEGQVKKYEPFSKYPPCYKDVSFWVPSSPSGASPVGSAKVNTTTGAAAAAGGDATKADPAETQPAAFHENDFMEIVRDVAGSLAENVTLIDEFVHPRTGKKSLCYRINYRSLERTLQNEEVNDLHERVIGLVRDELGVELRL